MEASRYRGSSKRKYCITGPARAYSEMVIEQTKRSNRIAWIAVSLSILTLVLTVLIKSIMMIVSATERVSAVEKAVEAHSKELRVVQEDIKKLLAKP